jgi:hypothetical protein
MANKPGKELSRRDALKLLGAAAGASVLANLPSKWSTPQLTAGVLPAHAQTSGRSLTCWLELDGESIQTGANVIPSPGVPISLHLELVLVRLAEPAFGLSSDHLTDNAGAVGVGWLALATGPAPQTVLATWTFTNPLDGTASCSPALLTLNLFFD